MIQVDESDPVGDAPPSFPYREVEIQRGVDPKQFFDLSTEIGRGKFGVVHICKEKSTATRFAAKFIQIQKKGDRRNVDREVQMMNILHHPKIAQLYAAYEYDRTIWMVMELVEGGELFDRVLEEKFILTEKACSIFMRQICDAMAYIHGNNIVHLDLKPENILCITESGNRIKIIDFGLAREYDPDNKLQVLFGTPEFVAPEVVNFEAISFATDMWSVGVIAYVLVSGLSPFAGEDDIQTMGNITIGRYDFLDEAFDTVSEDAIDFINRCLVKDQKERLTAEEALKHKWIKRKPQYYPTNRPSSSPIFTPILLDTPSTKPILLETNTNKTESELNKENLKDLVSKWNETPNNRYAFEQATENVIAPSGDTVIIRRPSVQDANGRRGSLARGDDEPLLLSPSSTTTSCCSSISSNPHQSSSEVAATSTNQNESQSNNNSENFTATVTALRPALAPLELVSNNNSNCNKNGFYHDSSNNSTSTSIAIASHFSDTSSELINRSFERTSSVIAPSPFDHSRSFFSDHSQLQLQVQPGPSVVGNRPGEPTTELLKSSKTKVCDELRMLSDLLKLSTTIQNKEDPTKYDTQQPSQVPQHNTTTNNNNTTSTLKNNSIPSGSPQPQTPLSPTLSTADLDSDLESLKSKVKFKTSKAQDKLNELAQQPDFLSNETFKVPTFKFLPKSISLCNDDSVFKENYTKFCDRNAIQTPSHLQDPSSPSAESCGGVIAESSTTSEKTQQQMQQEITTSTSSSKTQQISEGTKVIVTKTTKSSKIGPDGTKTVTVRKTIVKQKKITEEESSSDGKTKPPKPKTTSATVQPQLSQETATVKRTKFRVNQMSSRDVPVAMNNVAKRYLEQNRLISTESRFTTLPKDDLIVKKVHKNSVHSMMSHHTETESTNNLKNTMKVRSLSVDWDSVEAVENRSMKSINSYLKRSTGSTIGGSSAVKQIQAQIEASIQK
ncbi:death-associated protein kinase related-like isoform X1 [Uranotaenia lowii]|uniref:death-associated protein kinase related-like isoform X1 n=1 Tax=Uranotaenia lowii TaxID=190385 RepID=UPI0024783AF4|nr:death-associated protein kinase related-like isoform X1 [Uranotaenia lowii]XP_055595068.1 death-associated protein kinase related-like isoform X1 [Uranotaenia lowii]XP_055595069.1 death-associated protein kinase related-like isoform X1 [Uranotaenia lowii]